MKSYRFLSGQRFRRELTHLKPVKLTRKCYYLRIQNFIIVNIYPFKTMIVMRLGEISTIIINLFRKAPTYRDSFIFEI